MRHLIRTRRTGALAVAVTAGLLAVASPALADVTVNPPSAPQTSGANLMFHVVNTEQRAITQVKVSVPADTPIAEVYPLSNPDWAPEITEQKLSTPLDTIHGDTPTTEVTKDITWVAMPGRGIAPGRSADLAVSLGPLPTLSQMHFDVTPTYADGRVGPVMPPAVLKLTPATPAEVAAGHGGHEAPNATDSDPDSAQTGAQAEPGPSIWSIAGWVVAGLVSLGAICAALWSRRRDENGADDEEGDVTDEAKEKVGAGARKSSGWRYQDGRE